MLRRKIETQLEAWRSAPKRTALLVTGARQIGKTYIIRHFAQQHYDHIAELNFIENPDLVALFDRPRDAKNLLMRLELAVNTPLVPGLSSGPGSALFRLTIRTAPSASTTAASPHNKPL